MNKKVMLESLSFQFLVRYISCRLIISNILYASLTDLYKDYLYFIYYLPEFEKEIKNNEFEAKNVEEFVQYVLEKRKKMKISGLISKRQFGLALETVLKINYSFVKKKKIPGVIINGVGLKFPLGVDYFNAN